MGGPIASQLLSPIPVSPTNQIVTYSGAVPVTPGASYGAALRLADFVALFYIEDAYPEGMFIRNAPVDMGTWATEPAHDALFTATFRTSNVVPEPGTGILAVSGLLLLVLSARRRKGVSRA